jgi:GNAT superfamily N-acetyltransferase
LRADTVERVHTYWRGWANQGEHPEAVSVVVLGRERFVRAPDRLRGQLDSESVADLPSLVALLGDDVERAAEVRLAYLDDGSRLVPTDGVVDIGDDDARVAAAKAAADPSEWSEASIEEPCENRLGLLEHGDLVAMSTCRVWEGLLGHIGVFAVAPARGRGLGTVVGAAAAERAFALGVVAQWRSLLSNHASERVADSLGFLPLGHQLFVRIRTPR